MYLNLIDVLDNNGYSLDFSEKLLPEKSVFRGSEISFPDGINVSGTVRNFLGVIKLKAFIKCIVSTKCSRCTGDAEISLSFDYEDEVDRSGEDNDNLLLEGSLLNLDDMAYKAVISELPLQILCKEDCKGLCPGCGVNLNETSCVCPEAESDPRWDILKNLTLKDEV